MLVARADPGALRESARASQELRELGVANQQLVINGVLRNPGEDETAQAYTSRQDSALANAPDGLEDLPVAAIDLVAGELIGIGALHQLIANTTTRTPVAERLGAPQLLDLESLLDDLATAGRGVVMTMGKGGVGKTTIAAALAVALADRGHQVTLSTTDPAAHLTDTLTDQAPAGLRVERIDPRGEAARYRSQVLTAASGLDAEGLALLAEDLRSPCTEEIAVFHAFARTVQQAQDRIVVLDTAPTGHTLLLLDAAESYQREIKRANASVPPAVRDLAARLRDPKFARVIIVTLPESTPVHEAERLQADLRRAHIEPYGWLVNASLAHTTTAHPTLAARAAGETPHLARINELSSSRTWSLAWQPQAPIGPDALRALARPSHATR